ncbi:MAG: ATP-binding cassette domain-containing protein, partial [Clostridia bacterium]|nr:ATP-binding cassette domain-containing protein [Clostridia bacterium]
EDLNFSYDREAIFENAAFSLPKGSFAVVVGAPGVGKSTLLKLLLGVFHPDGGEQNARTAKTKVPLERATRKIFAYVPQGNLLLSGTLRENLTITKPEATAEEIAEALHVSALEDVLAQLPEGMDTHLGEDGAGLSEGQAQRLAIARAVLSGAHVLLLDEATSALDAETEKTVLERIRALENRSCIAVTHRSAAEEIADWRLTVSERGIRTEQIEH